MPIAKSASIRLGTMTTIETLDRALALRFKLACRKGSIITINYEARGGGWNRVTGMVRSVQSAKTRSLRPVWKIAIDEKK
jgi:hypothetical protein